MNHYQAERTAIETQVKSTLRDEDIFIQFDNDAAVPEKGAKYISCSIMQGKGFVASISAAPRRRYPGVVSIRIFIPKRTGNEEGDRLLGIAESAFVDMETGVPYQIGSGENGLITFQLPTPILPELTGGFYCKGLQVPYYRDQQGANY